MVNQLHYTIQCLHSLNQIGVSDSQIVVIDNGSTDGTDAFLKSRPNLSAITNATNRGCSAAWNQGVEACRTEWVVILNNDVVLAPGFCQGLVEFARQAQCDIVSPAKGEGDLDYDFAEFSRAYLERMASAVRWNTAYGSGFMVHRRVFDSIGLFDTKVGLAGNEDEDFYRRARSRGLRLAVTGRAYLHHFGSVTQRSVKAAMGLPNTARLSDSQYFRQKHRITWLRRRTERLWEKTRAVFWSWNETRRYGLTLKMTRLAGQWRLQ